MDKRMPVCANCEFFDEAKNLDVAPCRKYAPRPFVTNESPAVIWPLVHKTDWCGEFVFFSLTDQNEAIKK